MVRFRIAALALLIGCGGPTRVDNPVSEPVADPTEVKAKTSDWKVDPNQAVQLLGNEAGVRIELVPVLSKNDPALKHRYLIRATRSHSDYDGVVVLAERRTGTNRIEFITQFWGAPFTILHRYRAAKALWTFTGYEFAARDEKVQLVEEAFDADALIRAREEQRGSELRKIEPTGRAAKEAAQAARFKQSTVSVEEDCGPIKASIDWSTVSDSWFEDFSVSSECWPPLNALESFCEAHPDRAEAIAKNISISCAFQGHPHQETDSWSFNQESPGKLVYTPGPGDGSLRPLRAFLREALGEQHRVFRLGDRHFIMSFGKVDVTIYVQDGKTYFPATTSAMPDGTTFYLPSGAVSAELNFRADKWFLDCGQNRQVLEELQGAQRQAILDTATYESEPRWKRAPYFLSRDTHGVYYYVDRYQREFGGKRYRVFVGRRGQVKLTKLKRLVEDSEGTLFSTARGDLRLVVNSGTKTAMWIQGKKQTQLTPVSIFSNRKLIYDELGVYYGEELGLVCD